MYQTILIGILLLIVIYLLYQNYSIQREIYKIKDSFDELNNFLDCSIKKSKPKVLDTLSSIDTNDITDNVITYSNDVRRVEVETTINSEFNKKQCFIDNNCIQNNNDNNQKNNDDIVNNDNDIVNDDDDDIFSDESSESNKSKISESDNKRKENMRLIISNIKNSLTSELNDNSKKVSSKKSSNKSLIIISENKSNNISPKTDSNNISPKTDSNNISPKSVSNKSNKSNNILPNDIPSKTELNNELIKMEFANIELLEKENTNLSGNNIAYTFDQLNKMNINKLKEIAKKNNVVLSVIGKAKNKDQLINDILLKINN